MGMKIGIIGFITSAAYLSGTPALADATVTITATTAECNVSAPAELVSNSPSVPAGEAAIKNKNYALAKANFKPLADKGDAEGQRAYGELLLMKCTGLTDQKAGAEWLQKAADAGNMDAAAELGNSYMNGLGVDQDNSKAFALLSKAAAAGLPGAEVNLGYLYSTGRGVAKDLYQFIVWSVKAGEKGAPIALANIANAYFRGGALPQDNDQAAYYMFVAMERSTPLQKQRYVGVSNNILRAVSQRDASHALERAKRWSPGPGSLSEVLRDAAHRREQAASEAKN